MTPRTWAEQRQHEANERRKWPLELRNRYKSATEAGRCCGVDRTQIHRMMREHQVEAWGKPTPRCEATRMRYQQCADLGMTTREAADFMGLNIRSVRTYAKQNGIKFARRSKLHKQPDANQALKTLAEFAARENAAMRAATTRG